MKPAVLDLFNQNDIKPALEQALNDLELDFQQNKYELKQAFLDSFKQICENTKQIQQTSQPKIGFLTYHLLRTKVLQHKYTYTVMAYDKEWYRNDGIPVGEADFSFLYRHYENLWRQLTRESRKYIMQFSEPDLENIMLGQLDPLSQIRCRTDAAQPSGCHRNRRISDPG
ncbi:MAG: hypothetical protein LBQ71_06650 [Hungatella sp.]|jgi:hypothetical protein|nr:hypothetical protein [Hungatella sp.]